jgi:hypothetical protein
MDIRMRDEVDIANYFMMPIDLRNFDCLNKQKHENTFLN